MYKPRPHTTVQTQHRTPPIKNNFNFNNDDHLDEGWTLSPTSVTTPTSIEVDETQTD